jgi:uncharacterized peroxidase-related enzyme
MRSNRAPLGKARYTIAPNRAGCAFIQLTARHIMTQGETMSRLQAIPKETAAGKARQLLEAVQAKLNMTPNFLRVMAHSPAVLEGYLGFSGSLGSGTLPEKLREKIALAVAEANGCEYCVSAHTALGKGLGLPSEEIEDARIGQASSKKDAAALAFAQAVLKNRGRVASTDFDRVREAGFGDDDIAEIIAHVALNVFTNYFNIANQVEVDFPKVALRPAA